MKIKLTKKAKIILFVILGIVVLGSGGFLLWRVLQEETIAPEDSDAGTVGLTRVVGNCYNEKQAAKGDTGELLWGYIAVSEYSFNRLPTVIGPIVEGGEIVLYYKNLETSTLLPSFTFTYTDLSGVEQTTSIKISSVDSNGRAKIDDTGIVVPANGTVTITSVYDNAPDYTKSALGWEPVNEDGTCGSGLLKGATGGLRDGPYSKKPVGSDITWAQSDSEDKIISTQCWADSPEWRYDCDFEDYFLQVGYVPLEVEPYCGDGIVQEDLGEVCDPGPEGSDAVSCTTSNGEESTCSKACTCPEPQNPDWNISKTAQKQCVEQSGTTYATAVYTVTIKNTGKATGEIEKVVDQLDSKVVQNSIKNISDGGVYSDGEITWEIENNLSLSPNQSKEFTYTLEVPKVSFGTYDNSVTAYPVQGDNFSAQRSVDLTCDIDQPTTVPQTGLFDTVLGRVSVGVSFIFVGGLVSQYSRLNYFFNSISQRHEFKKEIKRQRRKEERMAKRRKKLENRFK